jgi:hypothetical protein
MVLSGGGWEERYPTVLSIYSFVKLRERRLRHCAGKFLEQVERPKHTLTMIKNRHSTTARHQVHHDNLGLLTRPHFGKI